GRGEAAPRRVLPVRRRAAHLHRDALCAVGGAAVARDDLAAPHAAARPPLAGGPAPARPAAPAARPPHDARLRGTPGGSARWSAFCMEWSAGVPAALARLPDAIPPAPRLGHPARPRGGVTAAERRLRAKALGG